MIDFDVPLLTDPKKELTNIYKQYQLFFGLIAENWISNVSIAKFKQQIHFKWTLQHAFQGLIKFLNAKMVN